MIWQRIPLKKSAGQADTQMRAAPFRAQVYCHRGRPATSTAMQASPRNTRHRTCWHLAADQVSTVAGAGNIRTTPESTNGLADED